MIDKHQLLRQLQDRITSNLDGLIRRQQDTQKSATHEENRAEHAKDTRATEQSYLARGLAARVEEARRVAETLASADCRRFDAEDPIALMALVSLRDVSDGKEQSWWLVPGPAGVVLERGALQIQTVTPAAPLGRTLLGLGIDDEGSFSTPSGKRSFEIIEIA